MQFLFTLIPLALAAEPTLPSVLATAPAVYPEAALEQGLEAAVLLELDIDRSGSVIEARVVEPAGYGFDAAAIQAVLSFRFTPGTDAEGEPVPATIMYRYRFELEQAPQVSVTGVVNEAGTRDVLKGARVELIKGDQLIVAVTDDDGAFSVAGLEDGTWQLAVKADGFTPETTEIQVAEGSVQDVKIFSTRDRPWEAEDVDDVIDVVGRRTAPEVTERVLSSKDIRYIPGSNGDVVKVVQNLPGVARPPLNIGQLLIRGTAPEDSAYYLDGGRIPNVFHFAGFSTVLNNDSIDEVAFLPGNYGVRFGRTLGGVVDIRTNPALPERDRAYASVDVFQATAFVEQRLSKRAAISFSGRRSYIDAVLNPILRNSSGNGIQAPRYYDLQGRFLYDTGSGTFDALFLASDDIFRFVGSDADGAEQVQAGFGSNFQKLRIDSREEIGNGWRNQLVLIGGPERQSFEVAPNGEAFENPVTFNLRNELYREGDWLGWRGGIDVDAGTWNFRYDVPAFGALEEADTFRLQPAAYLEPTFRAGIFEAIPGVRVDSFSLRSDYSAVAVDPRVAFKLKPGDTVLKATYGKYSQFPQVRQALDNPDLGHQYNLQASVGIEQPLTRGLSAEVTPYYNRLYQLVSGREDAFSFFSGPPPFGVPLDTDPYANDGVGAIYGVETFVKYDDDRTIAWLSGTFGRSQRTARPGQDSQLFRYDQPVVLTALASRQLPKRWRIGGRARLSSGNPYTPVVNRFFDLDRREFQPVYGERDSKRLPPFWQVDVRVDKDWVYRNWTLTAYLDLQNALNAQNTEVIAWTYDFSERDPITGIPVLPSFGIRGEI